MTDAPSRWLSRGTRLPLVKGCASRGAWFAEGLTPDEYHCHRVRKVLATFRTAHQECVLADLHSYGRCLILDGEMQSTQRDEYIYHEALIHPAMLLHRSPRRALIMGGGEGASLREALKHPSLRSLVMADIDSEVISVCMRHLPTWHRGAWDDPRVALVIEDARRVILESRVPFDVVFSDLPSAIRGGPAYLLYTREFYRELKAKLAPGGIFTLQAGSGQMLQWDFHKALFSTLKKMFRVVRPYYAFVPSYDVPWGFLICTDDEGRDPARFLPKRADALLRRRRIRGLRYFDGETCRGMFCVPKDIRAELAREKRVIRRDRPVFFFV